MLVLSAKKNELGRTVETHCLMSLSRTRRLYSLKDPVRSDTCRQHTLFSQAA